MAEEKVIVIKADTSQAEKSVKGLTKDVDKLGEVNQQNNKKTQKNVKSLGDSAKKTTSLFKGLGTAIKATGIGLVVSLVASLTAAFSKNQKFMNAFNTVAETISIVLSKVSDALVNVYESVSSNTENFNALGKVLSGLVTLILTPLKLTFFSIKLGIQQAQLSWEKSFFGGKDKNTIKELTLGILETKEAIFSTGTDAVKAGKDIVNNFGEAITETSNIAKKTQEELSKISIESAFNTAKANVEIRNTAKLAAAEQGRLVEIYDRLAEKQRQIRDDESISISERKKSNSELGKILEQQEKAMISQANAQIASANADILKNNTIDNQVALTEALANKEGILAQIEGFRSEQLVNKIALQKEELEITNTISDAEKERRLSQLEFEASQEENELLKLEKLQENFELENEIILEDLERKREIYAEGTQARVDAEQDYLTRKQEIDNKITANEKAQADERKRIDELVSDAKINIAQRSLTLLSELAGKGSKIGKGIAVTQATISGIEGVQKAYTTAQGSPITALFPAYPVIQAGLAGAFSALQIKKILATKTDGSGGSGGGGAATPSAPPPSFNLVQGTDSNQIAESISSNNERPTQAFVVGSNVTTQQELDRNKIEIGSI